MEELANPYSPPKANLDHENGPEDGGLPVIVKYQWTLAELLQANRYNFYHTCRPAFRFFRYVMFTLMILAGLASLFMSEFHLVSIGLFIVGVYWLIIRPFTQPWIIRKQFDKRLDKDIEIEWQLSPGKIQTRSKLGSSEFGWSSLIKFVHTPEGLLLYATEQIYHWLPRHGFANDVDYNRAILYAKAKIRESHILE